MLVPQKGWRQHNATKWLLSQHKHTHAHIVQRGPRKRGDHRDYSEVGSRHTWKFNRESKQELETWNPTPRLQQLSLIFKEAQKTSPYPHQQMSPPHPSPRFLPQFLEQLANNVGVIMQLRLKQELNGNCFVQWCTIAVRKLQGGGSITFAGDGTCSLHQKLQSHCTGYWNVSLGIALNIQRSKNTNVTQLSWASGLHLESCFWSRRVF